MKKILFIILWLLFFQNSFAVEDLSINANIDSWEYDQVLEVYLNSNNKDAKIYYYTDGIWRMNNLKEYKNSPIIIKKDTKLDYFATLNEFDTTIIKENNYSFNFPSYLKIYYEQNNIIIKNSWAETINLGYRNIKWLNLNYIIPSNTFLNPNEIYTLNYNISANEDINLYSPDQKVTQKYNYKPIVTKINKNNEQTKNKLNPTNDIKKTSVDEVLAWAQASILNSKTVDNISLPTYSVDNFFQTIIIFIILIIWVWIYNIFFSLKVANIRQLRKLRKLKKVYK